MIPEPPYFELRKWMAQDPLRRFDTFLLYVQNLEHPIAPRSSERAVADRLTDIEKRLDQLEQDVIDDVMVAEPTVSMHEYQKLAEANRALARESDQEHDRAEKATHLAEQHQTKLEQMGADLINANQRRDEAYARITQLERQLEEIRERRGGRVQVRQGPLGEEFQS